MRGFQRADGSIAALLCAVLLTPASAQPDGRQAVQRAATLVQQGQLDEAEKQARIALREPDSEAVGYSVLGTIRFQQQRLDESVAFFRRAIAIDRNLIGAHLSLAQIYTIQTKQKLALPLFQRVLELDPTNASARIGLARAETAKKNYARSIELANPVLGAFKKSAEGILVLATNYLKTGNRVDALELVEDWTRLTDISPEPAIGFGLLLAAEGAVPAAVRALEHASRSTAPSYELAFNLAGTYLLDDQPVRALDTYDFALSLKPESIPALQQAAAIAERQGELERSLSYWLRAKKIKPEDPETLLGFGRVCLRMDLLEDAEPALAKAAGLKPQPEYVYTLAAAKVGKRQFDAAQRLIEGLLDQRPADAQLHYALGSILYIQGQLPEAAARLRESLRLRPEQLASNYYLALVARDQGNDAEAIQRLEQLLERHPDHAASCEALGSLLMSAQRYPEAERSLRRAVALNPTSVRANYQLGLLLARMGQKEESERQLDLTKSLREEDETNSRLQLRLLDPGQ